MENRDQVLIKYRTDSLGSTLKESSFEEYFQNKTLRPILKFQNELLIDLFINYAIKQKKVYFGLDENKKLLYIEHSIQRDLKFRNLLFGVVIGFFTKVELLEYSNNNQAINKRMAALIIERLKSQNQLLKS